MDGKAFLAKYPEANAALEAALKEGEIANLDGQATVRLFAKKLKKAMPVFKKYTAAQVHTVAENLFIA